MIVIDKLVFNQWQENTYILHDETGEAVIIDCGCNSKKENEQLEDFLAGKKIRPVKLLNTHLHIDHVFGNQFMKDRFGLLTAAHKNDEFLLKATIEYADHLGLEGLEQPPGVGVFLSDGDTIRFGNSALKILHVPGHSPGGICFYNKEQKFVIVGDVLFYESIGRTDLPFGNHKQLLSGIKDKLLSLDDDVHVYPGHGVSTTIGHERKHNVFLKNLTLQSEL